MKVSTKGTKTRIQILEAALELFCKNGFEKTTMRDIAEQANLAVGAAYYYFASKDEIVFEFYKQTHGEAFEYNLVLMDELKSFRERLNSLIKFKIKQLNPYRAFIGAIGQFALDPAHPFSPFSEESKPFRDQAIFMFSQIIEGSDIKVTSSLKSSLPDFLWAYQMVITLFWIHDTSEGQKRTMDLVDHSLDLIVKIIKLSSLPPFRPFFKSLTHILKIVKNSE